MTWNSVGLVHAYDPITDANPNLRSGLLFPRVATTAPGFVDTSDKRFAGGTIVTAGTLASLTQGPSPPLFFQALGTVEAGEFSSPNNLWQSEPPKKANWSFIPQRYGFVEQPLVGPIVPGSHFQLGTNIVGLPTPGLWRVKVKVVTAPDSHTAATGTVGYRLLTGLFSAGNPTLPHLIGRVAHTDDDDESDALLFVPDNTSGPGGAYDPTVVAVECDYLDAPPGATVSLNTDTSKGGSVNIQLERVAPISVFGDYGSYPVPLGSFP